MKDRDFKMLSHSCKNYEMYSSGKEVQKKYSPDHVLKSRLVSEYIIIEHETQPNRKTIIADIFKAAHFLQNEKEGILIIVMTPKGKSSFESYHYHALPYFVWLKNRTNLKDIIFIHESHYVNDNGVVIINEEAFIQKAISLNSLI